MSDRGNIQMNITQLLSATERVGFEYRKQWSRLIIMSLVLGKD